MAPNFQFILPLCILGTGAVLSLLFSTRKHASSDGSYISAISAVMALASLVFLFDKPPGESLTGVIFRGTIYADSFTLISWLILLVLFILQTLSFRPTLHKEGITRGSEYQSLLLFSLIGAMILASASEFLTLFVGIELMSLPVYALCASALGAGVVELKKGAESGVKYLLLGSFGSAIFLLGVAFLFGVSGSTSYDQIAQVLMNTKGTIVGLGIGLVLVALLFKIGAAPFHFWVADVYEGAPNSITAYMSSVVKVGGVLLILRLIVELFAPFIAFWSGAMWTAALLSIIVGNLLATRQRSIKRLLAYSSIANVGYILCGLLSVDESFKGGAAALFYILVYGVTLIGTMCIVHTVVLPAISKNHSDDITRFTGLAYSHPVLAFFSAVLFLTLAGVPPALAGFFGKVFLFSSAVSVGHIGLVIVALLSSVIGAFYYLRVLTAMYLVKSQTELESDTGLNIGAGICTVIILLVGFFPALFIDSFSGILSSL